MARPTLVLVTGPAGAGKTTLAHDLARAIGCPVVCRDEIKEGMLHAVDGPFEPAAGDALTRQATIVFFDTVRALLDANVTLVAEAAFQDPVWRTNLDKVRQASHLRIIRCWTNPDVALARVAGRGFRAAHPDASVDAHYFESFAPIALSAPTVDVDTTSGYEPSLDEIVAFVDHG